MKLYVASGLTANHITCSQAWSSFAKSPWKLTEVNSNDRNQLLHQPFSTMLSLSKGELP